MTYAISYALQQGIFTTLSQDASVISFVGTDIFDAPPAGTIPQTYVVVGDETAVDRSSKTSAGAIHEFQVNVVSDTAGFATAKQVAAAVCDALLGSNIALTRGVLVALNFRSARALRDDSPGIRQINLKFRAFVEDD